MPPEPILLVMRYFPPRAVPERSPGAADDSPLSDRPRSSAAIRCLSSVRAARSRFSRFERAPMTLPSVAPMPAAMPIARRPPESATEPAEIAAPVPAARYGLHGEVNDFHVTRYLQVASPLARQASCATVASGLPQNFGKLESSPSRASQKSRCRCTLS